MVETPNPSWRQNALVPCRSGWWRTLIEGVAGYILLLLIGRMVSAPRSAGLSLATVVLAGCAWLWLVSWPAWRLRPLSSRRRWLVPFVSIPRSVALALALGVCAGLIGQVFAATLLPGHGLLTVAIVISLFFLPLRLLVLLGGALRRFIRRLRWQLLVSHVAIVLLTFALLTGAISLLVTSLFFTVLQPNPRAVALSVAGRLPRHGGAIDLRATQTMLDRIESGQLEPVGDSPLATIIPKGFAPTQILVLDDRRHVVASARNLRLSRSMSQSLESAMRHTKTWNAATHAAQRGNEFSVRSRRVDLNGGDVLAAAPIRDGTNATGGLVVVQATDVSVAQIRLLILGLFGVGTLVLILATGIPVLALSALFSYLVARGLTRRLEAVAWVTRAIAAGDLSQRAPVDSRNEIGVLASDVNSMAEHLGTAMDDLRAARAEAEGALRRRQELVANISHELRTPLAVLRAHLDTLDMRQAVTSGAHASREPALPPATLAALQHETDRLTTLVDDLFTLSRAESGSLRVERHPVDVAALADDLVKLMRPLALQEGHIRLSVEVAPGLPLALADADRLRQILANLIRNAVRHTPEGGIIVLSVTREDGWVVAAVADTGEGIEAEHLPFLFDRLYRVDVARSRRAGGAGLGLAIVREFTELMGGRVVVESIKGEGSCFRIFLPTSTDQEDDNPPPGQGRRITVDRGTPSPTP